MRINFFTTVALVATAAALPHDNDLRGSPATLEQRAAASTTTSASSKCTAGDTSTTDGVQAILDSTGAIDWLDIMFDSLPNGEKDWVNSLWKVIFPNEGTSPLTGCGDIGGDCNPDDMCSDYASVMGYWTLRSVGILHSKINAVRAQLLWTGWLDGLSIDQISKDFSTVSPDQEWAKWISAAFSMAGGIATGIDLGKPLRGMIGFAAAGLTDVSLTKGGSDAVDTTSVENTLRNIVGAAGNYVASILTNATGGGDSTTLPIYTYTTLEHGTSRFFADNTILLDENKDNSSFIAAYSTFADNVVCLPHFPCKLGMLMMRQEKKLVDAAMKTAWYVLVGEEDTKEGDCTMTGAYWLEAKSGEYRCFYLTRPSDSHNCGDSDPKTV